MNDTDVTDDDLRNARLWAEKVDPPNTNPGYSGTPRDIYNAARVIRAHVPAPLATLADEIREADWNGLGDHIIAGRFADRVEAVVKERDDWNLCADSEHRLHLEALERNKTLLSERDEARKDLVSATLVADSRLADLTEARAEVERLKEELEEGEFERGVLYGRWKMEEKAHERADSEVQRLTSIIKNHPDSEFIFAPGGVIGKRAKENLDRMNLPDPADVPQGEPYLVDVEGENEHLLGLRNSGEPHPWETFSFNTLGSGGWCSDTDITLVSRLVPDVRRVIDKVEDLDALPAGSIVLDEDGDPCKKISEGNFECGSAIFSAEGLLRLAAEVTLIYEPEEVTA